MPSTSTELRLPTSSEPRPTTPRPRAATPVPIPVPSIPSDLGALRREEFDGIVDRLTEAYVDARRRYLQAELDRVGGGAGDGDRILDDLRQQGRYMGLLRKTSLGVRREAKAIYKEHGRDRAIEFLSSGSDGHSDGGHGRKPAKRAA